MAMAVAMAVAVTEAVVVAMAVTEAAVAVMEVATATLVDLEIMAVAPEGVTDLTLAAIDGEQHFETNPFLHYCLCMAMNPSYRLSSPSELLRFVYGKSLTFSWFANTA